MARTEFHLATPFTGQILVQGGGSSLKTKPHLSLLSLNAIFSGKKEPSAPAVIPKITNCPHINHEKVRESPWCHGDLGKSFLYLRSTETHSKYPLKCTATGKVSLQLTRTWPAGSLPFPSRFAWIILDGMRAEWMEADTTSPHHSLGPPARLEVLS